MRRIGTVVLVILLFAVVGFSQTFRGAINGTVMDQSGAVVASASVKATNVATDVALSTVTTGEGAFAFQDLPLGTYKISVIAAGFKSETIENVKVTAGNIYTLPIKLTVGSAGTTAVDVLAAALTIDTTTATQSDTITDVAVQAMPLNGRDFSQLIAISPGYAGYSVGGFGSLNGTRANQMNWQLDGTDNNDFWHNIPAINESGVAGIAGTVMPIDAIDNFSSQSQSNAETGRSAGGTNNLTIKSGTNDLHGTAYYYNRNEFYAASSPFFVASADFPKAPELRDENIGATVGGPIKKDKAFFFLGFEYQNYIFGLTGLSTEPSNAWVTNAQALLTANGVPASPVSESLLAALWPSSIRNLGATPSNYFATVPGSGYSYNGLAKLDYNFNDNNHLSIHGFYGIGTQTQPLGASLALATASSNLGYYFQVAPTIAQNYSAVWNMVISPRLSNQVLFGLGYFHQIYHDANNTFNLKSLGLYTSPDAVLGNGQTILGAPNIQISGFDQIGITPPEGRDSLTGHVGDVLSYVVGKHQLRFGGEFRQGHVDESYYRRSTGVFGFDGTQGPWSGNCAPPNNNTVCSDTIALADFLAGDVSTSSIAVGDAPRNVVVNGLDFFGQDAWQVTRKLNLNLGLRYEYIGPLHNGSKDLAVFIPDQGLKIQGNGIDSIFPPNKHNFAPRFGFAYQPGASENLVVRGGVGVFFDQVNMNPFLDFRPPISAADGLADNPIGPHAVANYGTDRLGQTSYNWDAIQAGGNSIFPGLTTCPTLSGCVNPDNPSQPLYYNVYSVGQNFHTPYFYNYNLQLERSFGNGAAMLQLGYVGSVGHRLLVMDNISSSQLTAQYPNIGTVIQLNAVGNSNYNSLQSTFKIRSWHGLSSQFVYTWSHELDAMTEYRGQIQTDYTNPKLDYGSGDFDTRNNFTAFFTYDIPGSSHGPKMLTHDWQINSLMSFHSGQPFNFPGTNASGTQRPGLNLIGDPFAGVSHSFSKNLGGVPGEQWVNPEMFCVPGAIGCAGPANPNGDLGRNAFSGPGFADFDLSVIKNIPLTERMKLQLRAEMFNLFNRINLASGAGSVGSDGTVRDTIGDFNGAPGLGPGEPFNMQIAAKIIF
ncbi:MAG: carboxypeptidase regulatory-like domain-containing protein [Terriglobales bacterium]